MRYVVALLAALATAGAMFPSAVTVVAQDELGCTPSMRSFSHPDVLELGHDDTAVLEYRMSNDGSGFRYYTFLEGAWGSNGTFTTVDDHGSAAVDGSALIYSGCNARDAFADFVNGDLPRHDVGFLNPFYVFERESLDTYPFTRFAFPGACEIARTSELTQGGLHIKEGDYALVSNEEGAVAIVAYDGYAQEGVDVDTRGGSGLGGYCNVDEARSAVFYGRTRGQYGRFEPDPAKLIRPAIFLPAISRN